MTLFSKIAGIFLILFGFFMVRYFPGIVGGGELQPVSFSNAGIIVGFICIGVGVYAVWKL